MYVHVIIITSADISVQSMLPILTLPDDLTPFHSEKYSSVKTQKRQRTSSQRGGPRSVMPSLRWRPNTRLLQVQSPSTQLSLKFVNHSSIAR